MRVIYTAREKLTLDRAPSYQIFHTLRGILETGVDVRFVTPWPARLVRKQCENLTGRAFPDGLEVVSLGPGPDLPGIARLWPSQVWSGIAARLKRYLRTVRCREPDTVVYTRNRRAAAVLPKADFPPVVFEYHEPQSVVLAEEGGNTGSRSNVHRVRREEEKALENAAALVTVSRAHGEESKDLYRYAGRQWVIPNGADPTIFSVPDAQRRPLSGQLLYIGSIKPWKGLDLLLEAMARVPTARLTICGGNQGSQPWQDLSSLVSRLGITDRVRMVGTLPQQELRPHLASAMAGILPLNGEYSIAERYTSPLKLFEYLCAGLPVVATDLPSVRNIVAHEREALLFEDRIIGSLVASLSRLMTDGALAERLARRARETSFQHTWRHRGERIVRVCEAVLMDAA